MPRNLKNKPMTPLVTMGLIAPGFRGLNTELSLSQGVTETDWASVLENTVFDDLGRLAMRKGYVDVSTTPIPALDALYHMHEYLRTDGTVSIVVVNEAFDIFLSDDDGATWADITGALNGVLANQNLQFTNFDGDLWIAAAGHKVHQYNTGLGSFTEVTNSPVTSGSILGSYGRLWVPVDATSQVSYSGLLDGTDWTSTSSGTIDAANAWTDGQDIIQAVASFGATFLIFGLRHILVYVDGAGSVLGIDPDKMYIVDTVEGTGCSDRDSIINIGEGDLWFLGPQGIQSMARVIEDKVNPLTDISKNQRSIVASLVKNEVGATASVKAIYSHTERFVLFNFAASNTMIAYDLRFPLPDKTYRASTWATDAITGLLVRRDESLLFGLSAGNVGLYSTYRDDGVAYSMTYATPWMNFGQQAHTSLKILKSGYAYVYGIGTVSGTIRWAKDLRPLEFSSTYSNTYVASGAEFGSGEWGSGEFGEGLRMRKEEFALSQEGQFIKFYMTVTGDNDSKIALQEVAIRAKIGRQV